MIKNQLYLHDKLENYQWLISLYYYSLNNWNINKWHELTMHLRRCGYVEEILDYQISISQCSGARLTTVTGIVCQSRMVDRVIKLTYFLYTVINSSLHVYKVPFNVWDQNRSMYINICYMIKCLCIIKIINEYIVHNNVLTFMCYIFSTWLEISLLYLQLLRSFLWKQRKCWMNLSKCQGMCTWH